MCFTLEIKSLVNVFIRKILITGKRCGSLFQYIFLEPGSKLPRKIVVTLLTTWQPCWKCSHSLSLFLSFSLSLSLYQLCLLYQHLQANLLQARARSSSHPLHRLAKRNRFTSFANYSSFQELKKLKLIMCWSIKKTSPIKG